MEDFTVSSTKDALVATRPGFVIHPELQQPTGRIILVVLPSFQKNWVYLVLYLDYRY